MTIFYHTAPSSARRSIRENGINPSLAKERWSDNDKGFYVFDDLQYAIWYADYMANYDPPCIMDIYRVYVDKSIKIEPDFELGADEDAEIHSWFVTKNVPSQFVKLIKTIKPRRS